MKAFTVLDGITFVAVVTAVLHKCDAGTDYSYYEGEYGDEHASKGYDYSDYEDEYKDEYASKGYSNERPNEEGFWSLSFVSALLPKPAADADYSYYEDEYASKGHDYYHDGSGWFIPAVNGSFYWYSKEEWDMDKLIQLYALGSAEFYLYTNLNPEEPTQIYLNDVNSITNSNFNVTNPTRFLIHGFLNTRFSRFASVVRKALIIAGTYNIIVVDWSSMSSIFYPTARSLVPDVGIKVAKFIDFLNMEVGMPFEDLTLIGHSLGAHVSGFAGKYVENGKVDVIIGLDPASPMFDFNNRSGRLCHTDARFVQSIQTSNLLGFPEPIGRASFFPNGGNYQPGCGLDLIRRCAHSMSYIYYAEAILRDNFRSIKCKTREEANSKCGESFSSAKMGSPKKYASVGIYYVPVNDKSPYGDI